MSIYVKELIVVLGLTIPLFAVAKSTALLFMDEGDFNRRRNIWLLLTCVAFLSPSFWLFVACAAPVLYWGVRKDTNPIGFYLLLMTILPSIPIQIPPIGVKEIFPLDSFRLLSLCVLVPTALRLRKTTDPQRFKELKVMDVALLGLGALQVLLFVPPNLPNHVILHNSLTNDLRAAFLFLIDVYVLYYVASRSCSSRRKLRDALAAFCLSCALMAIVAIFEATKKWLLYTNIDSRWGGNLLLTEYYARGNMLRAQASSGQPLALGFLLVIGLGFWLYLQSHVKNSVVKVTVPSLLCAGLLVTFSRGPWLAAIVLFLAYAALSPRGISRFFKAGIAVVLLATTLLSSPLGTKISGMIPFMGGKVGESSLTYRERLFDRSWQLIEEHPIFGDQLAFSHMQNLVQGQGIIDIVNAYIDVTLFYGFTGLACFLTFILSALLKGYRVSRRLSDTAPDSALLGANLAAAIVAILVLLADGSLGTGPKHLFYALIGLTGAYLILMSRQKLALSGRRLTDTTDGLPLDAQRESLSSLKTLSNRC